MVGILLASPLHHHYIFLRPHTVLRHLHYFPSGAESKCPPLVPVSGSEELLVFPDPTVEGRPHLVILCVKVGPLGHQRLDHGSMAIPAGLVEVCHPIVVLCVKVGPLGHVKVGPLRHQHLDHGSMAVPAGPVEGCHPIVVLHVE